jgi:thymidylate kinase
MSELIALCGIDGTGKSTQASLLQARLTASGYSTKVLWCRWDPFLARPAVRLLNRLSRRDGAAAGISDSRVTSGNSRRALKRRLLSSGLVRNLWTGLMVLDYGFQVAPRLVLARRSAEVVIVDRYRHDVLVDLSAGGELVHTPRALGWLLPEPDLILILDVEEGIALSRKPDSPDITYLEERRQLYRRLAQGTSTILIDASESTEVVSESVFDAMVANWNLRGGISERAAHSSWH